MKTLKRSLAMLLSIVMFLPMMCMTVRAEYTPKYTTEAEVLFDLGLFKGTGFNADGTPVFDLDKNATRIQGIVMLIRLLGEEEAALACTAEHPFTDVPTWANSYVAYAYEKKYTNGTGNNTFGSDDKLLGKAYVTFVLRALGYNDATDDFSYNSALTFGAELGLIEAGQCEGELYRDDTALVSYNALRTTLKDSDTKLIEKLEKDGAVTSEAVQKSGLLAEVVNVPYNAETKELLYSSVYEAIPNSVIIACSKYAASKANEMNISPELILLENRNISLYIQLQRKNGNGDYFSLKECSPTPESKLKVYDEDDISVITVLDKDYNLLAYSFVPPSYSKSEIAFTLCYLNYRKEIEEIRDFAKNFEKRVPNIDSAAVTYEKDSQGELVHLKIDENKLPNSIKLEDIKYYVTAYEMEYMTIGGQWSKFQYSFYRDTNFQPIDKSKEERFLNYDGMIIFLCNENKEVLGYVYAKDGINMSKP